MSAHRPRAGVVGTFVAALHVDALRRLGVEVKGVVGSTPERARAKELAPAYESLDALLADEVDVVHVTTPNHRRHRLAVARPRGVRHRPARGRAVRRSWLGHRGRPNETLLRDPGLVAPAAAVRTGLPAGHAEGFADTFKELYRAVYAAVEQGRMPDEPDFPSFEDGHRAQLLGEAIAGSNRERRWISATP
jgi:predicted dehydrogenase